MCLRFMLIDLFCSKLSNEVVYAFVTQKVKMIDWLQIDVSMSQIFVNFTTINETVKNMINAKVDF